MERYRAGATDLFVAATEAALEDAGVPAARVDVVVTVSTTGIATPSLEARAARRLGLRPDVQRVPVFGLGCAGGASGLSIAQRLAAARPGSVVLLVAVETCTLAFRGTRPTKADMIATMLFGDGAAAACLSSEADGPAVGAGTEYTWPDTLEIMGWNVHDEGLGVIFDRSIPDFVRRHFRGGLESALDSLDLRLETLARPVCHPGGAKVLQAIEVALDLGEGSLEIEREVLRDFGNMSSPTVLFVLQRVLARKPAGQLVATALGPGFTASVVPVRYDA
jgi:alkylresorcinol/alkylpyrone synthase